jgi:hypothetical protein
MAYFIFQKSLRSLEEFRTNPHVKIPPKSASINFQSLGKFKNTIFNLEIPFSLFLARPPPLFFFQPGHGPPPPSLSGPVGPSPTPLVQFGRLSVSAVTCSACPIQPLVRLGRRLLRLSDSDVTSLSLIGGPTLSVSPGSSPSSDNARAHPRRHRSLATERRPAPRLGCHRTVTTSPSFSLP